MADTINSRKSQAKLLQSQLKQIISYINKQFENSLLSPLTITLGDEFQSILKNETQGIRIILAIEEFIVIHEMKIKLRYVLVNGEIETRINRKIAYGMLGSGLTRAREKINRLKKSSDRFHIEKLNDEIKINDLFILFQSIVDGWKEKDFKFVASFIKHHDYKIVAEENFKTASQMWKRNKSLKIREYEIVKKLILDNAW